jgi:hypothetical protein
MKLRNITRKLKSETILSRKPNLKICSNHLVDDGPIVKRWWPSQLMGTAISDGKGWYKKPGAK